MPRQREAAPSRRRMEVMKRFTQVELENFEKRWREFAAGYEAFERRWREFATAEKRVPLSRLKAAFRRIDRTPRGSDGEYRDAVLGEFRALEPFRRRADRAGR